MRRERRIEGRRVRRRRRIRARVLAAAAELGVVLLPWQVVFAVDLIDGERMPLAPSGRRAGRKTVGRVIERSSR